MTRRRIHTVESCRLAAQTAKCETRSAFHKRCPREYRAAAHAGWLDTLFPNPTPPAKAEWTWERVAEAAAQYRTRSEMRRGPHQHAYNVAKQQGWEDALPPEASPGALHRSPAPPRRWTKAAVLAVAATCATRHEFYERHPGAANAAARKGWAEEALAHLPHLNTARWTKAGCFTEARKFSRRGEWQQKSPSSYAAALRNGWLDVMMPLSAARTARGGWTRERAAAVAWVAPTRKALYRSHPGAWAAIRRNGWFDILPPITSGQGDYDVFYLWRAERTFYNGHPVFKFGATSRRLADARVLEVAKAAGLTAQLLLFSRVPDARPLERLARGLGEDPLFDRFDGYTEFRAYSEADLQVIYRAVLDASGAIL